MLVSLNWIREFVDLPQDLAMSQLAYDLTMRTVEVEGWKNPADDMRHVLVGEILTVEPHPNADRLRVLSVDVRGEKPLQIVCGGSNLYVGELVAVSVPGAWVRWHGEGEPVEIRSSKLRGVLSEGMVCAASELSLEDLFPAADDHEILDLTKFPGAAAGRELADVLGLNDWILEIDNKSMTNRPDLWGHYGIARELAAIYKLPLKPLPEFKLPENCPDYPVVLEDPADCQRYSATLWEGVDNRPTPYALRVRLHLLGHSSHGLLVDLSNALMLATGEPNHTFDADTMQGPVGVRRARQGESLELLDDASYKLFPEDLVITDADTVIGLAGIMGGKGHSIHAGTKRVLLEAASFAAPLIRRSSQRHDLRTDAEARFEKGVDTARVDQAKALFQAYLAKYFPEARLLAHHDACPAPPQPLVIKADPERLCAALGRQLSTAEMTALLRPLGFTVTVSAGYLEVTVPSWRATGDVSNSADLVEELARMIGYENFPFVAPSIALEHAVEVPAYNLERRLKLDMAGRGGLQEVFTYPWIDKACQKICGLPDEHSLALATPPAPEQSTLQQSAVPGLLWASKENERYYGSFGLFTYVQVYRLEAGETLPPLAHRLAAARFGSDAWLIFRQLKGLIEGLNRYAAVEPLHFAQVKKAQWADSKVWLNILNSQDECIGDLGLLSLTGKKALGFKRGDLALFELDPDALRDAAYDATQFTPLPQFPLVDLDFSVLIDEKVKWQEVAELLAKHVQKLQYIGEYADKSWTDGRKSLTFRASLGKEDGTLSSQEIEEKQKSIFKKLSKKFGAEVRR